MVLIFFNNGLLKFYGDDIRHKGKAWTEPGLKKPSGK